MTPAWAQPPNRSPTWPQPQPQPPIYSPSQPHPSLASPPSPGPPHFSLPPVPQQQWPSGPLGASWHSRPTPLPMMLYRATGHGPGCLETMLPLPHCAGVAWLDRVPCGAPCCQAAKAHSGCHLGLSLLTLSSPKLPDSMWHSTVPCKAGQHPHNVAAAAQVQGGWGWGRAMLPPAAPRCPAPCRAGCALKP